MSKEAATQEGVEQVEKAELPENPRNAAIAEFAAKARQERDAEIAASGETPIDTKADEPPEDPAPVLEEPETPELEAAAPEVPEAPAEEMVAIKVDGQIKHVPKDKIYEAGLRAVQKESAADKRLEDATKLLNEVQQRYSQPAQQDQPPSQAWDEATIAYALEHGNDEQKIEAVRQMRGRQQATPEQIAAYATSKAIDAFDFQTTADWFKTEYKDVFSDPYLLQLAAAKEHQLRNAGDARPRRELYKDIGDELRKWKGGSIAAPTLEQKRDQKATITNLPSASVRKAAPPEQKAKTPSDIIDDMRKRRGQA